MKKVKVEYLTRSKIRLKEKLFGVPDNMTKFSNNFAKLKLYQSDKNLIGEDLIIRSIKEV